MDAKAFVVAPKNYQRPLNVVGERITILASSQMTGGYEIFLQKGSEGSGPNPHSHPWDESFYVTKGEIDFGIGNETQTAVAGTLVHLPAGTTHDTLVPLWYGRRRNDLGDVTRRCFQAVC